jgi:hypothetical protein
MKCGSRDKFLHRALAARADFERRIRKFLHPLEFMVTVQAAVFIDGHAHLSFKGVGRGCLIIEKNSKDVAHNG